MLDAMMPRFPDSILRCHYCLRFHFAAAVSFDVISSCFAHFFYCLIYFIDAALYSHMSLIDIYTLPYSTHNALLTICQLPSANTLRLLHYFPLLPCRDYALATRYTLLAKIYYRRCRAAATMMMS